MKYFAFVIFIYSTNIFSSSCCGGGSSSSMIITGDNRAEVSLGLSHRTDLGQTNQDGYSNLNSDNTIDQKESFNLQAQYQVSEFIQVGSKLSLVDKTLKKSGIKENNLGIGDIDLQTSYEYLPEYTYSVYKPRGFVYSKLTIPTSKSLYDSESAIFSDVRGTGLYSLSLGHFLIKKVNAFSLKFTTEWTHTFGAQYSKFKLHDYEKFVIPMSVSYTFLDSDFTMGITDSFNYQFNKKLSGEINSKSSQEYFWELGSFVNYSPNREEIWSLSYSDSTLIGKSINSPLYRSIGLSYSYVFAL